MIQNSSINFSPTEISISNTNDVIEQINSSLLLSWTPEELNSIEWNIPTTLLSSEGNTNQIQQEMELEFIGEQLLQSLEERNYIHSTHSTHSNEDELNNEHLEIQTTIIATTTTIITTNITDTTIPTHEEIEKEEEKEEEEIKENIIIIENTITIDENIQHNNQINNEINNNNINDDDDEMNIENNPIEDPIKPNDDIKTQSASSSSTSSSSSPSPKNEINNQQPRNEHPNPSENRNTLTFIERLPVPIICGFFIALLGWIYQILSRYK